MAMELQQPQTKRTRRPSVRLGEIGDLSFSGKQHHRHPELPEHHEHPDEEEWSVVEPAVVTPTGKRRGARRSRWTNSETVGIHNRADHQEGEDEGEDDNPSWIPNPNGHGEEVQGAIEDGPNGVGLGFGRAVPRWKRRAREEVVAAAIDTLTPSLSTGVSGWLQELGLEKYSHLFELNEVDTEVLPLLTLEDLREMGVDAIGARRKMFSNIQALREV